MTIATVDRAALEAKVKDMYTAVAENPHGDFHFEMGRGLAERLGYDRRILDRVRAIEAAGLRIERFEENTAYQFISDRAKGATETFGVKSVSILARKP